MTTAKLYYLAAGLALITASIMIVSDGLSSDEYFRVGFLLVMTALLTWLGMRRKISWDG